MALFVVAFPRFSAEQGAWVSALRAEHDAAMHRALAPHVTLVFGTARLEEEQLAAHTTQAARNVAPFACAFARALAVRDALSPSSHVFLLPHRGSEAIVTLHDRLYEGPMINELRKDVAFVPHLTVARKDLFDEAQQLACDLEAVGFDVTGHVDELEVIRFEHGVVVARQPIALAGKVR